MELKPKKDLKTFHSTFHFAFRPIAGLATAGLGLMEVIAMGGLASALILAVMQNLKNSGGVIQKVNLALEWNNRLSQLQSYVNIPSMCNTIVNSRKFVKLNSKSNAGDTPEPISLTDIGNFFTNDIPLNNIVPSSLMIKEVPSSSTVRISADRYSDLVYFEIIAKKVNGNLNAKGSSSSYYDLFSGYNSDLKASNPVVVFTVIKNLEGIIIGCQASEQSIRCSDMNATDVAQPQSDHQGHKDPACQYTNLNLAPSQVPGNGDSSSSQISFVGSSSSFDYIRDDISTQNLTLSSVEKISIQSPLLNVVPSLQVSNLSFANSILTDKSTTPDSLLVNTFPVLEQKDCAIYSCTPKKPASLPWVRVQNLSASVNGCACPVNTGTNSYTYLVSGGVTCSQGPVIVSTVGLTSQNVPVWVGGCSKSDGSGYSFVAADEVTAYCCAATGRVTAAILDPGVLPALPPVITHINPVWIGGPYRVQIKGANFVNGAVVAIGAQSCSNLNFINSIQLDCDAPPSNVPQTSPVKVTNPDGQWGTGTLSYIEATPVPTPLPTATPSPTATPNPSASPKPSPTPFPLRPCYGYIGGDIKGATCGHGATCNDPRMTEVKYDFCECNNGPNTQKPNKGGYHISPSISSGAPPYTIWVDLGVACNQNCSDLGVNSPPCTTPNDASMIYELPPPSFP